MPGSRLTAHGSQPRTKKYLFLQKAFRKKQQEQLLILYQLAKIKDLKMIRRKKKKNIKKMDFEVLKLEAKNTIKIQFKEQLNEHQKLENQNIYHTLKNFNQVIKAFFDMI